MSNDVNISTFANKGKRMSETKTITINGRQYDARTGLAVDSVAPLQPAPPQTLKVRSTPAGAVHSTTQRSQTLNRRLIKKPAGATRSLQEIIPRKQPGRPAPNQIVSPHIAKFAPHPVVNRQRTTMDISPAMHPHVAKAHAISQAKANAPAVATATQQQRPTAQQIKHSALQEAIAKTSKNTHAPRRPLLKKPRRLSIVTASLAFVLLGSYFTYLNMPSLSVRVAAAGAGINANYPSYQPDGYSLNGLIGYGQGQVTMKFAANGSPQGFTIKQAKSSWDSEAVLDNYISPRAGVSYIPYTERGLTIYTYGNNAAWVNGGILYTIEGDAPLSSEQIRHIATSLL